MANENKDTNPTSPGDKPTFVSQITRQDEPDDRMERHRKRKMIFKQNNATITIAPGSGGDYTFELLDKNNRPILYDQMYKVTTKGDEDFASPELAKYFSFTVKVPDRIPSHGNIVQFFDRLQHASETKIAELVNFSITKSIHPEPKPIQDSAKGSDDNKKEGAIKKSGHLEYKFIPDLTVYNGGGGKEGVHVPNDIEDRFNQEIMHIAKQLNKLGYSNQQAISGPSAVR